MGGRFLKGDNYEKFEKLEQETKAKLECLNTPAKALQQPVKSTIKPVAVPVKVI